MFLTITPNSPLEQFAIIPLIPMNIGNLYFSFTNPSLFMLLTLSLVLLLVHFVTKKGGGNSVPNAWQSLVELIYDFVLNPVNEQIGGLSGNVKQKFSPRILVTFTFLLFRNLQGMIPYSFTVTSHFLITLGLSFSIFIGITIVGFQIFLFLILLKMEGAGSSQGRKKRLESASSADFSGSSSGDDDPDEKKKTFIWKNWKGDKSRETLLQNWSRSHFPENYPVFPPAEGFREAEGFRFSMEELNLELNSNSLHHALTRYKLIGIFGKHSYPFLDREAFHLLIKELQVNGRPLNSKTLDHLCREVVNRGKGEPDPVLEKLLELIRDGG